MNTTPPPPGSIPENSIKLQLDHTRGPVDIIHPKHPPVWIPVAPWRRLLRPTTVGRSRLEPDPTGTCCAPRAKITSFFRVHPAHRYWYFHSCCGLSPDDSHSNFRIAIHSVDNPPLLAHPLKHLPAIWSGCVRTPQQSKIPLAHTLSFGRV